MRLPPKDSNSHCGRSAAKARLSEDERVTGSARCPAPRRQTRRTYPLLLGSVTRVRSESLDLGEDGALGDRRPGLDGEPGDGAVLVGGDRVLHLHSLENHEQIAGAGLLAIFDRNLDDGAVHRGGDSVARGGSGARVRTALARLGSFANDAGVRGSCAVTQCEVAG